MALQIVIGVLRKENFVLLSVRQASQSHAGALEFPGGKVEAGEGLVDALVREFREEVGVETADWVPMMSIPWVYSDRALVLNVFETTVFEGEPIGCEGQVVGWQAIETLNAKAFPEANLDIINYLKSL